MKHIVTDGGVQGRHRADHSNYIVTHVEMQHYEAHRIATRVEAGRNTSPFSAAPLRHCSSAFAARRKRLTERRPPPHAAYSGSIGRLWQRQHTHVAAPGVLQGACDKRQHTQRITHVTALQRIAALRSISRCIAVCHHRATSGIKHSASHMSQHCSAVQHYAAHSIATRVEMHRGRTQYLAVQRGTLLAHCSGTFAARRRRLTEWRSPPHAACSGSIPQLRLRTTSTYGKVSRRTS